MLLRLGPDRQLARLGVGNRHDARQLRGQRAEHRFESLSLGRRNRIDDQLVAALDERGLLQVIDRLRDLGVLIGRSDGHQALAAGVHGHRRVRRHLLDHVEQAGRHGQRQLVELQLGRVRAALLRLKGLERVLDHRLIGRNGQGDQAFRLRVDREVRVGQDGLEKRQGRVRIDLRETIDLQLRGFLRHPLDAELLQRRLDLLLVVRRGPGHQRLGSLVDRKLRIGHDLLQRLHKLSTGAVGHVAPSPVVSPRRRGGRVGMEELVDRVDLQHPLLFRRDFLLHFLQYRFDQAMLGEGGMGIDPLRVGIEHELRRLHQLAQNADHRLRIGISHLVNAQLQRLRLRTHSHFRLVDRLDDRADHRDDPGHVGHQEFLRRPNRHRLAMRAQKRADRLDHRLGGPAADRDFHGDQLVLPPLVQVLHGNHGNDAFGNASLDVNHHQHPASADQRETLVDQHAVHQVDRFGGGVFPGVDEIERPPRRGLGHDERQLRLLGKPAQHLFPRQELKPELQALLDRLADEVAVLDLREDLGQLLVALLEDPLKGGLALFFGGLGLGGRRELLFPLGQKLGDLLALVRLQLQLLGHFRVGKPLEVRRPGSCFGRCGLGRGSLG